MPEWTVDELAREAGTTVRNIRVYQDRGLLDPPERRGRVGIYAQDHLDRLRLILRLLQRGYPMAAIGELLAASRGRLGLGAILGFDDAINRALANDEPEHMRRDELARLVPGDGEHVIARAMEAGILEADGDGFVTRAPGLVRAGADLVANGLPGDAVMDIGVAIWNAADDLARRMVDAFVDGVWRPFEEAGMPQDEWPRILGILDRSRDAVLAGVMSAFGGAIRQAIEAALERLGQPLELAGTQTQKELSASDDA